MFAHLLCPAILFPEKASNIVLNKQVARWYHFRLINPTFKALALSWNRHPNHC
jgi:hypothetical protein